MTNAEIQQLKEQKRALEAKLAAAQAQIPSFTKDKKTVKIGDKGTINFYGLGKFPTCLYLSQLQALMQIANSPEFKQFVEKHADKIAVKVKEEAK